MKSASQFFNTFDLCNFTSKKSGRFLFKSFKFTTNHSEEVFDYQFLNYFRSESAGSQFFTLTLKTEIFFYI